MTRVLPGALFLCLVILALSIAPELIAAAEYRP